METLIEAGARVDLLNAFGESILHYAVRFGRSDLVNLILSAVPKIDIKGMENKTPYEIAVQYKHVTIAKHLKKVEELFLWLDKHDLGAFKGVFLKNEIYKNLLSDLTDSLLEKMKVSPADRAKILQATKHLDKEEADMTVDMEAGHSDELDDAKAEKIRGELAELTPAQADGKDWVIDGKDLEYLKRLGSGTSGDVYKGLYKGQHVAIKVLKEMTEEQERDEFKKEFKVMCAVHHPNIVQFFGASFKPKLCMVMEYCARGSMYHVLRDETLDINWDRALTLMVQTTEGIHALHTNTPQIMHRDLKSLNLLVTDDWQVKVADFGLSRFDTAEALETLKQMRGTFAYCAPESYNGAKYTLKSDIYSMGIIFWEVINRVLKGVYEQPYSEYKNIQFDFQIIIQASKDNLRPTLPATTPEALAKLVKACVHEDNESRPSGPEVLALLASAKADYSSNKHQWDSLVRSVQVKGKK
jgi:serine/threonine protein kinase